MKRLEKKAALITGGASGIGLATAELFMREGCRVAIADISEKNGRSALKRLKAIGKGALFVQADVSKEADARRMVERTVAAFGRLDILFNNAGVLVTRLLHELTEEEWDRAMNINLKGTFLCSKHAVRQMLRQRGGAIINNASTNAIVADRMIPAYCASKGAIGMLTKAMAMDYARKNIRVNAILLGEIDTPLARQDAKDLGMDYEEFCKAIGDQHPIGRMGRAEEAARAVLFLASDDSSFVTGTFLSADGGFTAI